MRIESGVKIGFNDVMIKPKKSIVISRSEVKLEREFHFLHSNYTWKGVPVIASNMDTVGTFETAIELSKFNMLTVLHKHYPIDQITAFLKKSVDFLDFVSISTGIIESDIVKLHKILNEFGSVKFVCIDIANGYLTSFYESIRKIRDCYPDKIIIAGNVVTPEAVEDVLKSGADIVKVGIGSGSVCTTRLKTGIGYPQLSAVSECAEAARTNNGLIISDGGCSVPGDIAKAFGAGADFVMLGGMLAGHHESGGVTVETNGTKYKEFYGMSSYHSMAKHKIQIGNYKTEEGKVVRLKNKGLISNTLRDITGGLRSCCTYVGANQLSELSENTIFIRVAEQENQIYNKP